MASFASLPRRVADIMLDFALPPRCAGCGDIIDEIDGFCGECWLTLDWLGASGCETCGLPLEATEVNQHVVRAQYSGYREEQDVDRASRTETFVAMRLFIDNWRWAGVPIYLRTGKKLPRRTTEVVVQFKCPPLMLFRQTPVHSLNANRLVLRIQPDEGISLSFEAKVPGPFERLETVTMDFGYGEHFKTEPVTGYETLLFDAMTGDQTLFHRMDMVEAGWHIVSSILTAWRDDRTSLVPAYQPGTWGPLEADALMNQDRRAWRD